MQGMLEKDGTIVETYFLRKEQSLMNETTTTSYDNYNKLNYTTTDKLYILNKSIHNSYIPGR